MEGLIKFMKDELFNFCISTIVERQRLAEFALRGRAKFTQNRAWTSGERLFREAQEAGTAMPIILSDAAYNSETLLLWGILHKLEVKAGQTTVHVRDIQRIRGNRGRQNLTLRSSGEPIKPRFIRPYAICHTPPFL